MSRSLDHSNSTKRTAQIPRFSIHEATSMHLPNDIHSAKAMIFPLLLSYCCFLALSLSPAQSVAQTTDTLSANQTLQDGRTLVSSGQVFELGFFSPTSGNSSSRYLGMWYRNLPLQVVWIANRNKPIVNSTGQLSLSSNGSVSLQAGSVTYWSVTPSIGVVNGSFLKLLDNGNLVLGQANSSGDYIWQSFDNITDTLLPEMKLGWNLRTGLNRNMTSWMSADDPSDGQFIFSMDQPAAPQLVLWKGNQKQYRWGPWDGSRFSGSNALASNPEFTPMFNSSLEEVYYTYSMVNNSSLSRYVVTYDGSIKYLAWSGGQWITVVALQRDYCDTYSLCGPYGNCYNSDQNCRCLKGFIKNGSNPVDWTEGCSRIWGLDCGNGDGFVKYKNLKLPDFAHLSPNRSVSLTECQAECLKNCSCMAFTQVDVHGNGGDCLLWYGNLIDMKNYPSGGDVLYIRMARAEIDALARARRRRRIIVGVSISVSTLCGILMLAVICYYTLQRRKTKRRQECEMFQELKHDSPHEDLELPLLDMAAVATATDKFSFQNKIGQGGFGEVYKGVLSSGQDVAVKRLSQSSGQGLHEFKNEVILIAKLQHRNLVRLLGCCIHGEERMLIYEYLPNKSLDYHLFDQQRRKLLTWKMRFNIIMGIARGLLYLHEDSRLRIIHRDLKPSNVLLDSEMNPKISDFGIAKIFTGENTGETTRRIVGTYGYMSPEYALKGHFSVKSDVFSFGVLLLEIVSGHKNWGFYHPDHELNLIGHAWKLWTQDKAQELLDALIDESFPRKEVLRCIQIGLLCVQQHVEDRPTMSSVVYMLGNETSEVPQPKEPGFSAESFLMSTDSSSSVLTLHTPNELTMTGPNSR